MVQRLTYRRRHSYNTKSNRIRTVRTPGGRLTVLYREKRGSVPRCADTGVKLHGLKAVRGLDLKHARNRERTVSRAYGGTLSAGALRNRILRAFLLEEQKIVREVLRQKTQQDKKKPAAAAGKKSDKAPKKGAPAAAAGGAKSGPKKTGGAKKGAKKQ